MELELKLKKALEELRKNEEKKFDQTVDLIVNLQKFDIKRNSLNIFTQVPHKIKNLRGVDIVEINPKKEKSEMTVMLGAKILAELL